MFTQFTRTYASVSSIHMQDMQSILVSYQSSPAKKVCQEKTQVVYLYYYVYRVYRVSNKGMLYVRIIALANQKGGVGKTTSTINIGTGLTQFGRTVLLADLDPQAHLTYSLGLLTLNALTTATEVYIPLQTEFLALQGLSKLLQTVDIVKKRLNPTLTVSGIIGTRYDQRKKLNKEVVEKIQG